MPSLPVLLVLVWGVGSHGFPAATSGTREQDEEVVQNYLQNYYNLKSDGKQIVRQRNSSLVTEKLKQMQEFFGLKVTGKIDADTLNLMKQPRCGVPDVAQYAVADRTLRWEHTHLTYRIENYTPDLPRADVDSAIEKAFQLWSNVSPLTFTKVFEGQADIMISFVWRDHGDNSPFGGPGNVLAHAFLPGRDIGGDIHFDEEKTWTNDFRNFNLLQVAAHEVGHSLGLLHDNDIGSLMFPSYNYYGDVLLSQKDIDAIQALYGPSKNPIQPREPQVPRACDSKLTFDAITKVHGELFFFKNRFFLRTTPSDERADLGVIADFWQSLSRGVDAAYGVVNRDEVFFFKGSKYWAFNGDQMVQGYPKNIYHSLGFPQKVKKIDAAVHEDETGKTYFFVANEYWRYDENTRSMDTGFPKEIAHGFPGIGKKVDAVFQEGGFFYFFHGKRQYKFDPKTKRILTLLKMNSWFNCKNK
ncbi:interstitial collagenase-like [Halichoerus grypus]|uniref:interstitial collagenase-like n=1 Tax=Halichoerus grypus TaxID=9711 RepID=UPI001659A6F8|nr:interstitial collagenase-like [Halichoerus grypus]